MLKGRRIWEQVRVGVVLRAFGRFGNWVWGWWKAVDEVDGEVGKPGELVQRGSSRQRGRIRLLRARHHWEVLLIGRRKVVGEQELVLELERVRIEFVGRMPDRGADRRCCCTPLLL